MLYTLNSIHKRFIPTNLLTRFMLIIIVPVLISQLFAVYLFYKRHWYNVSHHTSIMIAKEISALIEGINKKNIDQNKGEFLNLEYEVIPSSLLPKSQKRYPEELEIFKKAIQFELGQGGILISDGEKEITLYLALGDNLLQIKLPQKSLLNPTTGVFVLWIIFLTVLLLSISLIFSKNQIKSIIDLTNAVENYGKERKSVKYKPSGASEIRQAGLAFLKMKDRLRKQNARRTQLLAMISHDLRTPLTRMKLQVELMDESEEKEELSYNIDSMRRMIDSYLDFSRGEGGEDFQTINISEWISEYVNNTRQGRNISVIGNLPVYALIKPFSFERALTNLIGNAFKYSDEVRISIDSKNEDAIIFIEDNGIGIKKEDRKRVFKPFYRADKSRSLGNSSGVGLGLAITKEIISGHFGTIMLDHSKDLKGLLVKIKLPLTKQ